jgi:integrase
MSKTYYTHTRYGGIIYAELIDPVSGKKLPARSTRTKKIDEAAAIIKRWLNDGIPCGREKSPRPPETIMGIKAVFNAVKKADLSKDDALRIVNLLRTKELIDVCAYKSGNGSIPFNQYLENFWTYSTSRYVQERLAHGFVIGKGHCYNSLNRAKSHWFPAFCGKKLNEITREDLKNFAIALSKKKVYMVSCYGPVSKPVRILPEAEKVLSPATINKILITGFTALKWAYHEGLIPSNPAEGMSRFSGKKRKRGVLTPVEAERVFAARWNDNRAYCAALLSCTTGLRSGEIRALRKSDIGKDFLYIRHAWSDHDLLKATKNGEDRKVPILAEVRRQLALLAEQNPYDDEHAYLFYSTIKDKPIEGKLFLTCLKAVCASLQIDTAKRNIDFHSFRHYYAARMADKMTPEQIARVTGHKSMAVFEVYADHVVEENLKKITRVGTRVFNKVLQPEKMGLGTDATLRPGAVS